MWHIPPAYKDSFNGLFRVVAKSLYDCAYFYHKGIEPLLKDVFPNPSLQNLLKVLNVQLVLVL